MVDVNLVLEKLGAEETQKGAWINVIGYLKLPQDHGTSYEVKGEPAGAHVQALVIWSAGPLDLSRYEAAVGELT